MRECVRVCVCMSHVCVCRACVHFVAGGRRAGWHSGLQTGSSWTGPSGASRALQRGRSPRSSSQMYLFLISLHKPSPSSLTFGVCLRSQSRTLFCRAVLSVGVCTYISFFIAKGGCVLTQSGVPFQGAPSERTAPDPSQKTASGPSLFLCRLLERVSCAERDFLEKF